MRILIDVSSRWSLGIISHLKGILFSGSIPKDIEIMVLGTHRLFDSIGSIDKNVVPIIDDSMPLNPIKMHFWRQKNLRRVLDVYGIDINYSVQGNLVKKTNSRIKYVVMSRNLQPHLKIERKRLPIISTSRLRNYVLDKTLRKTYERADGVIFLSSYVRDILQSEGVVFKHNMVIPHGVLENIRKKPANKKLPEKPIVLYVSDVMEYKFQWNVVLAIDAIRKTTGNDVKLVLVGKKSKYGWPLLENVLIKLNNPNWVSIMDQIKYEDIRKIYHAADIFVFASSVETISNTFIEAMASGLPIAYSNRRPMTDMLGEDGAIFEPEDYNSIYLAVKTLFENDEYRHKCAFNAYKRSLDYSWEKTARRTFDFLREVADMN